MIYSALIHERVTHRVHTIVAIVWRTHTSQQTHIEALYVSMQSHA